MEPFSHQTIDVATLGLATNIQQPGLMQRPHRHNEVEINYLERGVMTYLSGGKRLKVSAGQIAVFWAAIPHQVIDIEETAILYWITIPFATFLQWRLPDPFTQQVIRGQFVLSSPHTYPHAVTPLILFQQWQVDVLKNSAEHHRIALLEIEALLRRLALAIPSAPSLAIMNGSVSMQDMSKVEQIACFIADHYTESLHIDTIAHTVHLHPNYAMSLFRKHLGLSIVDYVTQYRLAHAQRLLIMTNANASEIALEAGFGSVGRFYTAFKHAYGQAPGAYRATQTLSANAQKKR